MKFRENPRVLIVYTTSQQEPFSSLEKNGALKTWTKSLPSGCQVISLGARADGGSSVLHSYSRIYENLRWGKFGRVVTIAARILGKPFSTYTPKSSLIGSGLVVNIPEGLSFLGFKLLSAVDYMLEENFEFLVYTNLSSYINTYRLTEILSAVNPFADYYAGKRLPSILNEGVSGSFIVLSRETCARIKKNRNGWNHAYLDDIALLRLTKKMKIRPTFLDSLNILEVTSVKSMNRSDLLQYPHFKCGPQFLGSQRSDFLVMRELNDVLFPNSRNS